MTTPVWSNVNLRRRFPSRVAPRAHPQDPHALGRTARAAADPPPLAGPPTDWGELVQAHHDREAVQVSPDELPVIDIHSL
jgi:hypothetical protein